jgi:hypothetical protein
VNESAYGCIVSEPFNEDLYFAMFLHDMSAPLPSAYEASLFSTETAFPEQVLQEYGGIAKVPTDIPKCREQNGSWVTVPNGMHKPWRYHSAQLLKSKDMEKACPFLKYVMSDAQR